MIYRYREIEHKYRNVVENNFKTMRIDVDDFLEIMGMAEVAACNWEEEEE